MKIEANSRQVPSIKMYTADKKYNDLLYGYLQSISYRTEDNIRMIDKKDIKYVAIGEQINVCRQKASALFKNLINIGLVIPKDDKYELKTLPSTDATLIPYKTLVCLNNTLNQNTISVYALLLNTYYIENKKAYSITFNTIKDFVGLSQKTRTNNSTIRDILNVLCLLGLVSYKEEDDKKGIVVTSISNKIKTH